MPKKEELFTTINTITIEGTQFHFIRVEGGKVISGKTIAAQVNLSSANVGGSYSSGNEEDTTILCYVSEGSQIFPLDVWEQMKQRLAEQTGLALQRIEITPKDELLDVSQDRTLRSDSLT